MRERGSDGRAMRAIQPKVERVGFQDVLVKDSEDPPPNNHSEQDTLRLTTIDFPIAATVLPELVNLRTGIITIIRNRAQICCVSSLNAPELYMKIPVVMDERSFLDSRPGDREGAAVVLVREAGDQSSTTEQKAAAIQRGGGSAVVVVHDTDDLIVPAVNHQDAGLPILYVRQADAGLVMQICKDKEKLSLAFGKQESLQIRKPSLYLDDQNLTISARWFLVPTESELLATLESEHSLNRQEAQASAQATHALLNKMTDELKQAMGVLQRRLLDAENRCKEAVEEARVVAANAEGRASFMEHIAKVITSKATTKLSSNLAAARAHIETLEDKLYRPEVQAVLGMNDAFMKKNRPAFGDRFDSSGSGTHVFSVGRASAILCMTKPSELRDQAEMLAGKAAEIVGSENAEVLRFRTHFRTKANSKFFNQWYNLLQWRTLSKVVKEGSIPFTKGIAPSKTQPRPAPDMSQPSAEEFRALQAENEALRSELAAARAQQQLHSPLSAAGAASGGGGGGGGGGAESSAAAEVHREIQRSFMHEVQALEAQNEELWRQVVASRKEDGAAAGEKAPGASRAAPAEEEAAARGEKRAERDVMRLLQRVAQLEARRRGDESRIRELEEQLRADKRELRAAEVKLTEGLSPLSKEAVRRASGSEGLFGARGGGGASEASGGSLERRQRRGELLEIE